MRHLEPIRPARSFARSALASPSTPVLEPDALPAADRRGSFGRPRHGRFEFSALSWVYSPDQVAMLVFLGGLLALVFLGGIVVARLGVFPYPLLHAGWDAGPIGMPIGASIWGSDPVISSLRSARSAVSPFTTGHVRFPATRWRPPTFRSTPISSTPICST